MTLNVGVVPGFVQAGLDECEKLRRNLIGDYNGEKQGVTLVGMLHCIQKHSIFWIQEPKSLINEQMKQKTA